MAFNINQRLNGLTPLSYLGDNAVQPPDFVTKPRPPTSNDSKNFYLGQIWLDTGTNTPPTASDIYMLVALSGNQATWVTFGAGSLQTLTGNSGGAVGPDGAFNINVVGDGTYIDIVGNPGTNTLTASLIDGGEFAKSFPTDSGTAVPVAGALKIWSNNVANKAGATVKFLGSTNEVLLQVTDATLKNTFIGESSGNSALVSGQNNTSLGYNSFVGITTGSYNTVLGSGSGGAITTGSDNVIVGENAGANLTTGSINIILGQGSGNGVVTGSSNIYINNAGAAESNTIRIGEDGIGAGQQNACYMAGVYASSFDNTTDQIMVIDANTKVASTNLSALPWTPSISFGGNSVGVTYALREGIYQALGNLVFYAGGLVLTSKGSSTGLARIDGLPFASSGIFTVQFGQAALNRINFTAGYTYGWCINDIGTASVYFSVGGSNLGQIALTDAEFANNSQVSITGFYFRS